MKPKILAKISQLYLDESVKDEKKLKKNIFQDLRGSVTVPNEHKVAYWLRRKKRENASEKTFFVRPQRPLRFRTIPPLLLPALYALPAIIGGIKMYLKKISCCIVLTFQEWVLAWFSSARGSSLLQPCPRPLLPVTLFSLFCLSLCLQNIWKLTNQGNFKLSWQIASCHGHFRLSWQFQIIIIPNETYRSKHNDLNKRDKRKQSNIDIKPHIKPTGRENIKNFIWIFAIFQANNENNDGDMNTSNSMNTITNTGNTVEVNNNRRRRRSLKHLLQVIR